MCPENHHVGVFINCVPLKTIAYYLWWFMGTSSDGQAHNMWILWCQDFDPHPSLPKSSLSAFSLSRNAVTSPEKNFCLHRTVLLKTRAQPQQNPNGSVASGCLGSTIVATSTLAMVAKRCYSGHCFSKVGFLFSWSKHHPSIEQPWN